MRLFINYQHFFRWTVGCPVGPYRKMVDERARSFLNPPAASAEDSKKVTGAVMLFPDGDSSLVVPELARSPEPSAEDALGTRMLHQSGNLC